MVRDDVYRACLGFFHGCSNLRAIIYTAITLVPKVVNPTFVKDFRPISYAKVIYKIIAKVLSKRMQKVSPYVVGLP